MNAEIGAVRVCSSVCDPFRTLEYPMKSVRLLWYPGITMNLQLGIFASMPVATLSWGVKPRW